MPEEHDHELTALAEEHDECEGGWVRIPIEGWLPLQQLNVRAADDAWPPAEAVSGRLVAAPR